MHNFFFFFCLSMEMQCIALKATYYVYSFNFMFVIFFLHEEGRIKEFFWTQLISMACDVPGIWFAQFGRQLEKDLRKCVQAGLRLEDANPD